MAQGSRCSSTSCWDHKNRDYSWLSKNRDYNDKRIVITFMPETSVTGKRPRPCPAPAGLKLKNRIWLGNLLWHHDWTVTDSEPLIEVTVTPMTYFLWGLIHVPSSAVLCWWRSPAETSDRAVSVWIFHPASHGVTQEQRRFLVKGTGHHCLGRCGALIGLEFLLMDLIVLSEKEIACC